MANAPTFTLPPPQPKKSKQNAWQVYVNQRPGWKSYSTSIQNWAGVEGIDKLGLMIALTRKYGAAPTLTDAQIHAEATRLAAYVKTVGWDAGYQAYSGNKTVKITGLAPKGYVFTGGLSPTQKAVAGSEVHQAKIPYTNPYVYVGADGSLKKWGGTKPPTEADLGTGQGPISTGGRNPGKGTVARTVPRGGQPLTYFGQPLTLSDYDQLKQHVDGIYLAYAGRRATHREMQQVLANGTTDFQLQQNLAGQDSFTRSPVWKQTAPSYLAVARGIYGEQWSPTTPEEKQLLRNAVVNNIGGTAFADQIRRLPGYVGTQEFKAAASQFSNVYRSIYGQGNPNELSIVKEATLAGWSPEQFSNYLRSLPEYTASGEYLYKATALADALGLITGQQTTLKPGQAPPNMAPKAPPIPNDPRIKGDPNKLPPQGAGLTVGP